MTEIWKKIKDFPNYEVSNLGNVRSVKHLDSMDRVKGGQPLKACFDGKGNYLQVNLYANGKINTKIVHRLVAEAFVDNPDNLPEVNHKDENKCNNAASNLEWCTHVYNNNYGSKIGSTRGEKNPMAKITQQDVNFIRNNSVLLGGTMRNKEFEKMFNISSSHVSAIIHGRRW